MANSTNRFLSLCSLRSTSTTMGMRTTMIQPPPTAMRIGTMNLHRYSIPTSSSNLRSPSSKFSSVSKESKSTSESQQKQDSKDSKDSKDSNSKKTAGDYFLDHLGNIFLSAIAMIVLALIRSSRGTSNRTALRTELERDAALDPAEIDDLRIANSELDRGVFETIVEELMEDLRLHGSHSAGAGGVVSFGGGNDGAGGGPAPSLPSMTYPEFISRVMQIMKRLKGDEYTIQMGHLIDRVVLTAIDEEDERHATNDQIDTAGHRGNTPFDLSFLLAVLSLAMRTPTVRDRIEVLFDVLHRGHTYHDDDSVHTGDDGATGAAKVVSTARVRDMVGYLQRTGQLVVDTQIVEDDTKYPFQLYRRGTPDDLMVLGTAMKKDELGEEALIGDGSGGEGRWTCDDFHHMLRSRSVCAWGECYTKKKGLL